MDAPPQPITQEQIVLHSEVDSTIGFVVTKYLGASGHEVGLASTYSLQKANAGSVPPPS